MEPTETDMFQRGRYSPVFNRLGRHASRALAVLLLCAAGAAGQEPLPAEPQTGLSMPISAALSAAMGDAPAVRRLTLAQAQQIAAAPDSQLARLGELQVEAARQHRRGVQSLYFPNVSTQFEGLHFTEPMGQILTLQRPFVGSFLSVPINVFNQSQIVVNLSVVQPLTQVFAVKQLVRIARADENIVRAKAGLPIIEIARRIEQNYFDLLIAERELAGLGAEVKKARARWVTVSDTATPGGVTASLLEASRAETAMTLA